MSSLENKPGSQDEGKALSFDLPSYASYQAPGANPNNFKESHACDWCEQHKPDVLLYSLPKVVILPGLWDFCFDETMKCPPCMRRHILFRLPIAAILSNIISPIVVVWWLGLWVSTFFRKAG